MGSRGSRSTDSDGLLAAGVPDSVALEVMGHADRRILHHYQEVVDELKHDAAVRMDELAGGEA